MWDWHLSSTHLPCWWMLLWLSTATLAGCAHRRLDSAHAGIMGSRTQMWAIPPHQMLTQLSFEVHWNGVCYSACRWRFFLSTGHRTDDERKRSRRRDSRLCECMCVSCTDQPTGLFSIGSLNSQFGVCHVSIRAFYWKLSHQVSIA